MTIPSESDAATGQSHAVAWVLVWIVDPGHGQGHNAHWRGKSCWSCGYERVYDPHHVKPVPCTQPEGHVQVTLANWRSFGRSTTASARIVAMSADELRAKYGRDLLPVAASETPAARQNGEH